MVYNRHQHCFYILYISGNLYISVFVFFTEEERRVRGNDREYNEKFQYAVSRTCNLCIININHFKCKVFFSLSFTSSHHLFHCPQSNCIMTSKYNTITFLPVNLFEQFQEVANTYFLFLLILQVYTHINSYLNAYYKCREKSNLFCKGQFMAVTMAVFLHS